MKIGFHTFEQFHGKKEIGSSRIRAKWLVDNWSHGPDIGEAELFVIGQKYDVVIYQKAYWIQHAKEFKGIKILDLCDPDWMNWTYPVKEMIDLCDAVTCSSFEIAKFVTGLTDKPVVFIPDRMVLEELPKPKVHKGEAKTVAWFGYAHNFSMVEAALTAIKKRKLKLIVISEQVFIPSSTMHDVDITNLPWNKDTYLNDLLKADIVINPQLNKGRWKYKSNNKTVLAWSLGLPVAHTDEELDIFASESDRIQEAKIRLEEVKEKYDIQQSVYELKELIHDLQTEKGSTARKTNTKGNT